MADRVVVLDVGRIIADGTVAELARLIVGEDEVRWTRGGVRHRRMTGESTRFAFELFRQYGDSVTELEVRRASLEDTYLALVRQVEEMAR